MTSWPEEHPGRSCAKCGEKVYLAWSDPVYPPPGTCMFNAPHARYCDDFRARCINHLQIAYVKDCAPHPDFIARLERAGVSLDEAICWRQNFQEKQDAKSRAFLKSRRYRDEGR